MEDLKLASERLEVIREYTKAYTNNKCEVLLTAEGEIVVFYGGNNRYAIKVGLDDFNTVFDMIDFIIETVRKDVQ